MSNANTAGAIARITKEFFNAQQGHDLSIAVACLDSDVRQVRALIIGPPETPYEFGFFEFELTFPSDYPSVSPKVKLLTTNSGKTRFNPNLYADGKVCLSILGTWRGESGEQWSSVQGLESILISIQSLMSANPYENEPGYETAKKDDPKAVTYTSKIRHETLRISVIQRLEGLLQLQPDNEEPVPKKVKKSKHNEPPLWSSGTGHDDDGTSTPSTDASIHEYDAEATFNAFDKDRWDPFADLLKRRFLWYYDTYMQTLDFYEKEQADGTVFKTTEFEFSGNAMKGQFDYKGLKVRMGAILCALQQEQVSWEQLGAQQVLNKTQLATQLAFQQKQLQLQWNEGQYSGSRIELSLRDPKNPFVWHLTLFGEVMTNLDGGIFNMTLHIPTLFPEALPRLTVQTPMFHIKCSSKGNLCYVPQREDDLASHLKAIVAAIDDKSPSFDPRANVNPTAFGLYWGGDDKRKLYNRKLRRSAQESSEF